MKVKLKLTKTGDIREVSVERWELMKKDGRSRNYTVVPDHKEEVAVVQAKPKKEKIEIKSILKPTEPTTDEGTN